MPFASQKGEPLEFTSIFHFNMEHISAYNKALIVFKGKVAMGTAEDHRLQDCSSFLSFM
jgi:hypothetical protein